MREGKGQTPPSTDDRSPSQALPGGLGLVLPGIRLSEEFRARLNQCDEGALRKTLAQDAAALAAQLTRFNTAHAISLLQSGEHKPLWSVKPLLGKLFKPFLVDRVAAELPPERCERIQNERQAVRTEIEGILKSALAQQGITDPYDTRYHAIRDYHRNLMYEVRRISLRDQREVRRAIFVARSAAEPAEYNQILTDIQRAESGSYGTALDSFFQRHPELQPHRQAFDQIFDYLNKGHLNAPALPGVVDAFHSLPERCRGVVARDFRAWFEDQTTFFTQYDQCVHKHEVKTVGELERFAIAAQHLTQLPEAVDGLVKYMLLNVLRHDGGFYCATTVRELKALNQKEWYEGYNTWMAGIGKQTADSLLDIAESLDGVKNEAAPPVPAPPSELAVDEYGGAQALLTERLKLSLGETWLATLRRLWQENGARPSEKEIRAHHLVRFITAGDKDLKEKWVRVLRSED